MRYILKRAYFLFAVMLLAGMAVAFLARDAAAQTPGAIPEVSNNTGTVFITLTRQLAASKEDKITIDQPGVRSIVPQLSFHNSPITVTVLIDSVAGGGDSATQLVADTLRSLVKMLAPDDHIGIAITDWAQDDLNPKLKWDTAEQGASSLEFRLLPLKFNTILNNASTNDQNFIRLITATLSITGTENYVIFFTNGVGYRYKKLSVPALLVQLQTLENAYAPASGANEMLAEYEGIKALVRINDNQLSSRLNKELDTIRSSARLLTYTTTYTQAHDVQLIINGTVIPIAVPADSTAPTPAASVANESTETSPPAATTSKTADTNQPDLLPFIIGVGILLVLATLVTGMVLMRQSKPHLLIGKHRVNLRSPMWLGRDQWPTVHDDSLAVDHAQITYEPTLGWVIKVQLSGYMRIDGLRSSKNRLRAGARIALGDSGQAMCAFMDSTPAVSILNRGKQE